MLRLTECPACGTADTQQVICLDGTKLRRYLEFSRVKYGGLLDQWLDSMEVAIDRCTKCGHHWYREQPDSAMLAQMYASAKFLLVGDDPPPREATSSMREEMRRIRRLARKERPTILDYGSGLGRWARAAAAEGFTVTAYEPAISRGAEDERVEFRIVHDIGALASQEFDVINFEQVLEHLPDPVSILVQIRGISHAKTVLRIRVPNILRCSEGRRIWDEWPFDGRRMHSMAPFEHLHGFTPQSLRAVAHRACIRLVKDFVTWQVYPIEQARHFAGKVFPRLGSTMLLARPG